MRENKACSVAPWPGSAAAADGTCTQHPDHLSLDPGDGSTFSDMWLWGGIWWCTHLLMLITLHSISLLNAFSFF